MVVAVNQYIESILIRVLQNLSIFSRNLEQFVYPIFCAELLAVENQQTGVKVQMLLGKPELYVFISGSHVCKVGALVSIRYSCQWFAVQVAIEKLANICRNNHVAINVQSLVEFRFELRNEIAGIHVERKMHQVRELSKLFYVDFNEFDML